MTDRMRIALIGTRGPGFYGGFETCVAELAPRLAAMGHEVRVYARSHSPGSTWRSGPVGVVTLPSLPTKHFDTFSHTALSTAHLLARRSDVAVCFGVGNAPFAWALRRSGVGVVLNVDGLDRLRAKWSRPARAYLGVAERWSVRAADVLVTDARTVKTYYTTQYGKESTFIPYGAPAGPVTSTTVLDDNGLVPGSYILYVSRLEPENNCHVLLEAYRRARPGLPLVIVGGSAYHLAYEQGLRASAGPDTHFLGFVFGTGYAELQSHASLYVQCTEIGGTHPALVEAMAYGNAVIALDTPEHREVLGDTGEYYRDVDGLGALLVELAADATRRDQLAQAARHRAAELFSWDAVAEQYAEACAGALAEHRR